MRKSILIIIALTKCLSANAQFFYDINTQPDSSSVWVNGVETCVTPCRVKFFWRDKIDGRMSFAVKTDGYETWSDTISEKPYKFDFHKKVDLEHTLPKFTLDSVTPVIGFDKLLAEFDDGTQIGTFKKSKTDVVPLEWEGRYKIGESAFTERFYEIISQLGFRTPYNGEIRLFKNDETKILLPRYVIGAKITDYKLMFETVNNLNNLPEIKGVTHMDIDWKVLDKKTNKVVLTYSNRGTSRSRQSTNITSPDNLLAFEDAFYDFLRKSDFYHLINSTETGIDYMAGTDSTASPPRNIELPPIAQFEKLSDMIKYANPACVTIITDGGFGSGAVIDEVGYVLSAYHVVDGVNQIQVKFANGLKLDAEIIAYDYPNDVVLLNINGSGFKALPLYNGGEVPLGEEVITIGTPANVELGQSIAKGLISGRRLIDGHVFLQADIAVSPGNSGGPLLNTKGEIIGIVQSKIVNEGVEGIGFALPIDQAIEKLNLRIVE